MKHYKNYIMNRKELNQLAMLEGVLAFLKENMQALGSNPAIAAKIAKLEEIVNAIRDLLQVQMMTTKAATLPKKELEAALKAGIGKVCDALLAFGTETDQPELITIGAISESEIRNMRDSNLVDKARLVAEAAESVTDSLAAYFVSATDIADLKEKGAAFRTALTAKTLITAQTKESTAAIKTKLAEGRSLLKDELDKLMRPFKTGNPTLFGIYTNARAIYDIPASRKKRTSDQILPNNI